jgi:16S rRNA (adenine1518-N6/adenine1519-N6)-dimethyltransferase
MIHHPRKRFGQNFLVDGSVVTAIIAAVAPRPRDSLVEIGPGLGALTRPLAERLDHLHIIEIDRDLVARLRAQFPPNRVTVHGGDALDFDFGALGPRLRVVGNLPYNISTPLLFHLARYAAAIRDVHVMLQKEVVERMIAAPCASEYGRLSVMLQYRFEMALVAVVPPSAFRPAPKVESALVRMSPLAQPPHAARDETRFGKIVAAAFAQRRKMLRNALRELITAQELAALGVDPGARAEALSVEQFVRITNAVVDRTEALAGGAHAS